MFTAHGEPIEDGDQVYVLVSLDPHIPSLDNPIRIYLDPERLGDGVLGKSETVDTMVREFMDYQPTVPKVDPPEFLWCEGGGTCWVFHATRPRFLLQIEDSWNRIIWMDGCDDETRDILVAEGINFAKTELLARLPSRGSN